MEMRHTRNLLKRIIADENLHARFLNSMSYLEYRGARKMARALQTEDIDDQVLAHAMEESRHALYLKKMAMKIGGPDFKLYRTETLVAEESLKRYFHELDSVAKLLITATHEPNNVRKAVYHFVTWLIEERAIALYQQYEELLREVGSVVSLKPILADEENHLHFVKNHVDWLNKTDGIQLEPLVNLENRLFWQAWNEMEQAAGVVHAPIPVPVHA